MELKSKRGRSAAAWACQIAETIVEKIEQNGGPSASLPMELPWLGVELSGSATRIAQEVNMAKKQFNAREERKKFEREAEQAARAKTKGEIPSDYIPRIQAWALKVKDLVPGENGIGTEKVPFQARKTFYVDFITGRKKASGRMDELAWKFMEGMGQFKTETLPGLGLKKDAYEVFAELSGEKTPEEKPATLLVPPEPTRPVPQATLPDAQEELLANYLKGEQPC